MSNVELYRCLNVTILLVIVASMLLVRGWRGLFGSPQLLANVDYPYITTAFWFFFSAWGLVMVDYVLRTHFGTVGDSRWGRVGYSVLGNAAALCLLASSIAYLRGNGLLPGESAAYIIGIVSLSIFLFVWGVIWWVILIPDPPSAISMAVAISPDFVFAIVALLLVGWAVFVRWWGVSGITYLILCILYAMAQFPAGLYEEFDTYLKLGATLQSLELIYVWLAWGKLLVVFGFLSLLCSEPQLRNTTDGAVLPVRGLAYVHEAKYWPNGWITYPASWKAIVELIILGIPIAHTAIILYPPFGSFISWFSIWTVPIELCKLVTKYSC